AGGRQRGVAGRAGRKAGPRPRRRLRHYFHRRTSVHRPARPAAPRRGQGGCHEEEVTEERPFMRANPVKRALKAGQPSVGTWLSLGSITASRFLARAGFAWLTVDIEHSLVDWETATHMFASIAEAGCTALARVPANRHDHIKRVLDNGA